MGNRNARLRAHMLQPRTRRSNDATPPDAMLHLPPAALPLASDGVAVNRARQEAYEISRQAWRAFIARHPDPVECLPTTTWGRLVNAPQADRDAYLANRPKKS